ncbi:MAG: hypothetical protein ABGW82_06395 [Paracoccus sp. (in: a-proteobacteria)]|jgi:hypothetical protein|uniref:hypothetical protein n=1 Tax=unclassified Paracoccus (in: a-proteobacteria) TaxID=2688777 RepID=UPI000C4478D4|nr:MULTISPECIES: hypothetical protein [unclassified Paracoccus (in: a-proteobacteria)]MBA49196.1 hypothetical protein [Paracoccus sp. (in: a-proteobacteria)]|tara:strand:- start:947 stop:1444 length:498 start_codon:yes stop_codon:yes gene_type:complete
MFTTTPIGRYQLSLLAASSGAPAAQIGSNQLSLFLRPITTAGETAIESVPDKVEVQPEKTGFSEWLARANEYRGAANGGNSDSGVISYGSRTANEAAGNSAGSDNDAVVTEGKGDKKAKDKADDVDTKKDHGKASDTNAGNDQASSAGGSGSGDPFGKWLKKLFG